MTVSQCPTRSSVTRSWNCTALRRGDMGDAIIRGAWEHEGRVYHDDLMRVVIDVADTEDNHRFFRQFKDRLKSRFRQIDIWMTTHTIDIV